MLYPEAIVAVTTVMFWWAECCFSHHLVLGSLAFVLLDVGREKKRNGGIVE